MTEHKKVLLMILDGWGKGDGSRRDAIATANTPYMDSLLKNYPNTELGASGKDVGLPKGQMGNSEVGHLNIGAGRIVYQDLVRINNAIKDGSITKNKVITEAYNYAKQNDKAIHFLGLVSDGGVHSSTKHLMKMCDIAKDHALKKVYIHAFTDGRDTDPYSGKGYVKELQNHLENSTGKIATVCGRYYAMDRDKRWERIKLAYDMLLHGKGNKVSSPIQAIEESYKKEITDEFIKPAVVTGNNGEPTATIKPGDVVICFNFRTDRLREITTVLTQKDMPEHDMKTINLYYVTMTRYDEAFKNVHIIFEKPDLQMTLGETLSKQGKKQIRIAETEKYAHVTFFFSGGREETFKNEKRILIPSPKVATYDLQPEMSANKVKEAMVKELEKQNTDFICLNFANPDMVGHTGVYKAIIKALETIDNCAKEVTETAKENGYSVIIIADHGNPDIAVNEDGSPNTAHSTNPVPFILIDKYHNKNKTELKPGRLCDVAPTILKLMNLEIPKEMDGKVLINS